MRPTSSQRRNPSHAQHTSWGRSELTLSSPKPRKSLALAGATSPPSFFGQRPREAWRRAAVPPPRSHTHTRAISARPCSLASLGGRAKLSSSKVRGWGVRMGEPNPCRSPLARLSPARRPLTLRHAPQTLAKKKQFASDWFQGTNREKIIWRFLIGLLKRLHRPFRCA